MTLVDSIPLSPRVVPQAGERRAARRLPCVLGEFLVGPENQLVGAVFDEWMNGTGRGEIATRLNIDVRARSAEDPRTEVRGLEGDGVALLDAPPAQLLVLHGSPGTGKSHLAFGLSQWWKEHRVGENVQYLVASDFWRGLHEALDGRQLDLWRDQIRSADLLVLEDLSQLASRTTAQAELLHTLDALAERSARVVITSRVAPAQIATLLPGLQSRFSEALVLELPLPSPATRRALVKRLAQLRGTQLQESALRALAEGIAGTAPELFGALLYLESQSVLEQRPIGAQLAQQYVARRARVAAPTLRGIAMRTARHFTLKVTDLKSPSRSRAVVAARDVAMYLARQLTPKSLEQIGEYFGGRDHTTVLHGCRKTEALVESDTATRQTITLLRQALAGGA